MAVSSMALHCRWVWLWFALFAPRCTPIPLFHLESWFSQCEKPSRSGEVCSLCGWAAASTGNESETQRTLASLQIFYRIITGLWWQMTGPQILYNRSGFSSKFKWLAAVVRAFGDIHLVLLFFYAKLIHGMECFPNLSGLWMHLSIPSGIGIWKGGGIFKKKKPGAEVKLPSITFKLTSQSFTANWAIWLQFKVLYWLNKPEPLKCLTKLLPKTAWEYSYGISFSLFFLPNLFPVDPDHRWVKNAAKHLVIYFLHKNVALSACCIMNMDYVWRGKTVNVAARYWHFC